MFGINISDLHTVGSELFQDVESFLDELSMDEIEDIRGGCTLLGWPDLMVLLTLMPTQPEMANRNAGSLMTAYGNGINNNTINGQTLNGQTAPNVNTLAI